MNTAPLDYRTPQADNPRRLIGPAPFMIFCCFAAPVMLVIAARVELLNARAGQYLPRKDEGEWRQLSPRAYEYSWRSRRAEESGDPSWHTRPLTASQAAALRQELAPFVADSDLFDFVSTFALAQYVLVPLTLLAAAALAIRRRTRAHLLFAVTSVACALLSGALAVHRGYFTAVFAE